VAAGLEGAGVRRRGEAMGMERIWTQILLGTSALLSVLALFTYGTEEDREKLRYPPITSKQQLRS
jgi:hypothetical protein